MSIVEGDMTTGGSDPKAPFAPDGWLVDDASPDDGGAPVGADDAEADAVRSGAEGDLAGAARDSYGVPVGRADRDADIARSGGDPDDA
jgi:hypothetical protein